jgi:hypothetical protein
MSAYLTQLLHAVDQQIQLLILLNQIRTIYDIWLI